MTMREQTQTPKAPIILEAKNSVPVGLSSMDELVRRFLYTQDIQETTRGVYRKCLNVFFSWVNSNSLHLSSLNAGDVIRFKEDMMHGAENRSLRTAILYVTVVRRFFEWTEANKLYPNIAKGVKVRHPKELFIKQHLRADQCEALLAALKKQIEESNSSAPGFPKKKLDALRNYAMISLMLRTGLRTIEVSRLNVGDLGWKAGKRILKVWGKGRDAADDFVPVTDGAAAPLKEYLALRGPVSPADPLFICDGPGSNGRRMSTRRIQAICKDSLRAVGLDSHEYSAHSLRHTTAVLLLKGGASMFDVKHLLRHSRIETSEIYVKSIELEQRLQLSPENVLDTIIKN